MRQFQRSRSSLWSILAITGIVVLLSISPFVCCGGVVLNALFKRGSSHGYPSRDAYKQAELDARVKELQPTLDAIQKYRQQQGIYPRDLEDLVDAGLLKELPPARAFIDHMGEPNRVATTSDWYSYRISEDRQAFGLFIFIYFADEHNFTALGYAHRTYLSRTGNWEPGDPGQLAPELKRVTPRPKQEGPMPRVVE